MFFFSVFCNETAANRYRNKLSLFTLLAPFEGEKRRKKRKKMKKMKKMKKRTLG